MFWWRSLWTYRIVEAVFFQQRNDCFSQILKTVYFKWKPGLRRCWWRMSHRIFTNTTVNNYINWKHFKQSWNRFGKSFFETTHNKWTMIFNGFQTKSAKILGKNISGSLRIPILGYVFCGSRRNKLQVMHPIMTLRWKCMEITFFVSTMSSTSSKLSRLWKLI